MSHPATVRDEDIPPHVFERRWYILGVLCTSLLVIVMANTSMNVALPTMARELGLSSSAQQWVVDAYSLVFAGLLFTTGTLGDRFGRKGFLQAGLVLFGIGSVFATFVAGSAGGVILARAVMGIGGALVMPTTLSILVNAFPTRERPRAIAIWAGIAGGGGAIGLVLGGWLVEHFWWGSTFAVNIPVTVVALALGAWILPASKDPSAGRIDVLGSLLSIAGLGTLVFGLIEAPHWGWTSAGALGTIGAGLVLLALFVAWETRTKEPMLDMRLFRDRRFGVSSLGVTLVFMVMFGFFFIVVQLFQLLLGYGPFESGLRMLPFVPVMIVTSTLSPRLVQRFGTRSVVVTGMVLTAVGVLLLSGLDASSTYGQVLVGMFVMAGGMGLTMTPMTDLIMSSVPRDKAGVGSAMNDTTRELGTTLGVAILGSLLSSAYTSSLPSQIDQLPAPAQEAVRGSLGGALAVSQQIGGETGRQLADAAKSAWSDGVQLAFLVGAGIVFVAAAISFLFLDRRSTDAVDPDLDRDDRDGSAGVLVDAVGAFAGGD